MSMTWLLRKESGYAKHYNTLLLEYLRSYKLRN